MKSNKRRVVSNRRIVIVIVVCCLCFLSCEKDSPTGPNAGLPALTIPWADQNSVVCFGTSLTYGYGAAGRVFHFAPPSVGPVGGGGSGGDAPPVVVGDSSYPRFLQEQLRITVYNQGYVGARASYGLQVLSDSVLSKSPVLVLLEFGANEFLQGVDAHQTDSVLSILAQDILQTGCRVALVSFINPDMARFMSSGNWTSQDSIRALQYYSMLSDLAGRYSIPFVDYPLRGVFGYRQFMSDNVHPNGIGYKKMEENIFSALYNTFETNGMLK